MMAMLRCPACNEVITANADQCKYCAAPLDQTTIAIEVQKFAQVSKAVAEANTIKASNAALLLVAGLCVYLLIMGRGGLDRV